MADIFEKEHKHVIQSIEKLGIEEYFVKSEYTNSRGRNYPMYQMTKEGFLLLTSSYRGVKALEKKIEILKETDMIPPTQPERRETKFFKDLKEALQPMGIKVDEQYSILKYKVDGYIKEFNLVIEYDEEYHDLKKEEDDLRQEEIIKELNCEFVRLSASNSNAKNIGIVFQKLYGKQSVE